MNSAEQYFYGLVVLHVSLNVKCDWLGKGGYFLQHLFTTCKMQNERLNYGFQGIERGNVCFLRFCFFVHWFSDFLFHEDKDKQKTLRSIHMRSLF